MNPTTTLSLMMNILSIMILMTSNSWMTMWMAFELNMISFIPIMMNKNNNSTPESMMKYFMIQTIGSIMMILTMILNKMPMANPSSQILLTMSMLTKLGAFPVFQWLPSISEGMTWMTLTMLLTSQKIMPMILLNMMGDLPMMFVMAALSAIIGAMGGYNQTLTRKMLAYSSITHMGWMLMIIQNKALLMTYIMIYSMIVLSVTTQMKELSLFNISNIYYKKSTKMLIISMLSLGGLPPMLGFIPKLLSINWLAKNYLMTLPPLILGALINLSYYMNIMMKTTLSNNDSNNLKKNFLSYNNMTIPSITLTFSMMMMI